MSIKQKFQRLAAIVVAAAVMGSTVQASERDHRRSGFDDLSREMSTCAAYFTLLATIVENAAGPPAKAHVVERIKATGQAMLTQSINVAKYAGIGDDIVTTRVRSALNAMVAITNNDPQNSLQVMHVNYGQPCDELLQNAPRRFAELVEQDREDF